MFYAFNSTHRLPLACHKITGFADNLQLGQTATMKWIDESGTKRSTKLLIRIDTPIEVEYYQHGGILDYVIRNLMVD